MKKYYNLDGNTHGQTTVKAAGCKPGDKKPENVEGGNVHRKDQEKKARDSIFNMPLLRLMELKSRSEHKAGTTNKANIVTVTKGIGMSKLRTL